MTQKVIFKRILKTSRVPADPKVMKGMDTIDTNVMQQRSSLRLKTLIDEPVYLQVNLGDKISLLITELGGGGARVLCREYQEFFDNADVGRSLGKCVLMLREEGTFGVEPVIRWKKWPCIGVQFSGLSDNDRTHLFRFLFELERKKIKRMNMEEERWSTS